MADDFLSAVVSMGIGTDKSAGNVGGFRERSASVWPVRRDLGRRHDGYVVSVHRRVS